MGLEPTTSWMPFKRSPSWATTPYGCGHNGSWHHDFPERFSPQLVPKAGLEPARPKPPDFESGTSTNSITRANKTHLFVPKPPASVGSRYWEFQQLTRLSSSVSGPVSGSPRNLYAFLFSVCLKLVSCIKIDLGISVLESGNPNPSTIINTYRTSLILCLI